ncbi:ROK family protein [Streptomyces sp. NPDC001292]|uniref:ROK family protein n=1 Tax=Streptomyces sp. NPDC001292 TaxID=3364558 RepID=UPI003679CB36
MSHGTSLTVRYVIALDVGSTSTGAALIARDGTLLDHTRRASGREHGAEAVAESVLDFVAELRDRGPHKYGEAARGVGVAVPGAVDEDRGLALFSANPGWRDVPMRSSLSRTLQDLPFALGHDVRSAGLAEAGGLAEVRLGAARDKDRFLFISLGDGIGGAVGTGGRIESGAHGFGGEFGHLRVRPGGRRCACGAVGCLETVAGVPAIAEAWARASGDPTATAVHAARAAAYGAPQAVRIWKEAVAALADAVVAGVGLRDPRTVVTGGELAAVGDILFVPLRTAIAERLTFQAPPEVVPAALKGTAGCQGVGLLAWELLVPAVTTPCSLLVMLSNDLVDQRTWGELGWWNPAHRRLAS